MTPTEMHTEIQSLINRAKIQSVVDHQKGLPRNIALAQLEQFFKDGIERLQLLQEHEHVRTEDGFCKICMVGD